MRLGLLILFFLEIDLIFGIRCYSCVGETDKNRKTIDPCLNPAENVGDGNVNEIECLNSKLCWKAIAGGKIKRGCGEKRCAFIPEVNLGSLVSQTCCANDLCNRTSFISFSKWIIYFCTILIFFIK